MGGGRVLMAIGPPNAPLTVDHEDEGVCGEEDAHDGQLDVRIRLQAGDEDDGLKHPGQGRREVSGIAECDRCAQMKD